MASQEGAIGCLGVIAVAGLIIFGIAYYEDAQWANKIFYWMNINVGDGSGWSRITIQSKPHDCEFMTAPMGSKNCHFEKVVSKVLWASRNGDGAPIRSFDNGQTWEPHPPGKCDFDLTLNCPTAFDPPGNVAPKYITTTGVIIQWKKVQE